MFFLSLPTGNTIPIDIFLRNNLEFGFFLGNRYLYRAMLKHITTTEFV